MYVRVIQTCTPPLRQGTRMQAGPGGRARRPDGSAPAGWSPPARTACGAWTITSSCPSCGARRSWWGTRTSARAPSTRTRCWRRAPPTSSTSPPCALCARRAPAPGAAWALATGSHHSRCPPAPAACTHARLSRHARLACQMSAGRGSFRVTSCPYGSAARPQQSTPAEPGRVTGRRALGR